MVKALTRWEKCCFVAVFAFTLWQIASRNWEEVILGGSALACGALLRLSGSVRWTKVTSMLAVSVLVAVFSYRLALSLGVLR
jgi:hypothetical protein